MKTALRTRARRHVAAAAGTALLAGVLVPAFGVSSAAAAPLPAPVTADTSAQDPKQITLSWAPVEGATGYQVQVGTDGSWSDVPTLAVDTVATRLTLPAWLPHADYVWRVAARNEAALGRWSATTDATSFERGWSAKPRTTLTVDQHGVPTFSWTPVPSASEYQIQVSNVPTFTEDGPHETQAGIVTQACFTTHTRLSFQTAQAVPTNTSPGKCHIDLIRNGEPFYWRVRGLDQYAEEAPEVDTTPVVDEGISHLPPNPEPEKVDLKACPKPIADPAPSVPVDPETPSDPDAPEAPAEKPKVLDCEPANPVEKGAWSATKTYVPRFSIPAEASDYRTLAKVQTAPLPSDVCQAGICRDFPTISWSAVPGASSYRVYVALDKAYSNIHQVIETPSLQWTPTTSWRDTTARQAYYFAVQPCTSQGCGGVTSAPPSFRKASPPVKPVTPADGANVIDHDVVLQWTDFASELAASTGAPATSDAFAYRVQVSTPENPDFHEGETLLVDDAVVDATSYVSDKKRYEDGEYLWRVQAIDASGHHLPWSAARTFFRDRTAPTVLRTSPQGWAHADGEIRMRFSEPVTGVSDASVTLSNAPAAVTQLEPTLVSIKPLTTLRPGAGHRLRVSTAVKDVAGNSLVAYDAPLVVGVDVDETSRVFSWAGPWTPSISTQAAGGSFSRAVPDGRTHTAVDFDFTGSGVVLNGCKGPGNGIFEVWVDGGLHSRVDGYAPFSSCGGPLVTVNGLPWAAHHVQVRGIGGKQPASSGTVVGLDGIHVIR